MSCPPCLQPFPASCLLHWPHHNPPIPAARPPARAAARPPALSKPYPHLLCVPRRAPTPQPPAGSTASCVDWWAGSTAGTLADIPIRPAARARPHQASLGSCWCVPSTRAACMPTQCSSHSCRHTNIHARATTPGRGRSGLPERAEWFGVPNIQEWAFAVVSRTCLLCRVCARDVGVAAWRDRRGGSERAQNSLKIS